MSTISLAREWVGTPFRYQGRLKGVGVDCVGLILGVGIETGAVDPGYSLPFYEPEGDPELIASQILNHATEIDVADVAPGDIAALSFDGAAPRHLAFVGDCPEADSGISLIHAYSPAGKVVEQPAYAREKRRIKKAWRVQWDS